MSCNPGTSEQENTLIGLVLCGGKSSRMGTDKGLLRRDGETWASLAMTKLEAIGLPTYLSINKDQRLDYEKEFNPDYFIEDRLSLSGPLGGILSVYNKLGSHDIFVVACDLPDLGSDTLRLLQGIYLEKSGEHDFFVYEAEDGHCEPLIGIYTAEGLGKIFSLLVAGQLEKMSMKYVLEIGNTYTVKLGQDRLSEFKNYNQKRDIEAE